jgi:hypothetical protein
MSARRGALASFALALAAAASAACGGLVGADFGGLVSASEAGADSAPPADDSGADAVAPDTGEDVAQDVVAQDATTPFERLKQGIVGDWIGTRTDPWDPAAIVRVHFDASGTYTAHCVPATSSECAFHYESDDDLPNKTYDVYDLHMDGTGIARLFVVFPNDPNNPGQGTMDSIVLDATGSALTFDFYPSWLNSKIGPIHFTLNRAP